MTVLILSDSILRQCPNSVYEYLKGTFESKQIKTAIFPGKNSSDLIGPNGKIYWHANANTRFCILSFGQNDIANINPTRESVKKKCQEIQKDLETVQKNFPKCQFIILPLHLRKVNKQTYTRFPESKSSDFIEKINDSIKCYSSFFEGIVLKNIFFVEANFELTGDLICTDGLHLTHEGIKTVIKYSIDRFKNSVE